MKIMAMFCGLQVQQSNRVLYIYYNYLIYSILRVILSDWWYFKGFKVLDFVDRTFCGLQSPTQSNTLYVINYLKIN